MSYLKWERGIKCLKQPTQHRWWK